jgi:hypothetical protein
LGDFKVVDEVALGTHIVEFFGFRLLITIPPLLYIHLSLPHKECNSPGQAVHYYISHRSISDLALGWS